MQPQFGPFASGALSDAHGVGVTNNEVQQICPGQPSSFVYSHEGMLYNPVAWALAQDALSHDGPGQVSRLGDLDSLCATYLAQGLDNENVLLTEDLVIFSLVNLSEYQDKVEEEPPIKSESSPDILTRARWVLTLERLCFVAACRLGSPVWYVQQFKRWSTCSRPPHPKAVARHVRVHRRSIKQSRLLKLMYSFLISTSLSISRRFMWRDSGSKIFIDYLGMPIKTRSRFRTACCRSSSPYCVQGPTKARYKLQHPTSMLSDHRLFRTGLTA